MRHLVELAVDLPDHWTWGARLLDTGGWGLGFGRLVLVVRLRPEGPGPLRLGHIRNCEFCGARLARLPAIACCDYACPNCGMHWIEEYEWLDQLGKKTVVRVSDPRRGKNIRAVSHEEEDGQRPDAQRPDSQGSVEV